MPAFIGLPGAREKTEIGRGLFERSGNFFAAGKKLRNTVILTTAGRKNLF